MAIGPSYQKAGEERKKLLGKAQILGKKETLKQTSSFVSLFPFRLTIRLRSPKSMKKKTYKTVISSCNNNNNRRRSNRKRVRVTLMTKTRATGTKRSCNSTSRSKRSRKCCNWISQRRRTSRRSNGSFRMGGFWGRRRTGNGCVGTTRLGTF